MPGGGKMMQCSAHGLLQSPPSTYASRVKYKGSTAWSIPAHLVQRAAEAYEVRQPAPCNRVEGRHHVVAAAADGRQHNGDVARRRQSVQHLRRTAPPMQFGNLALRTSRPR
jgi:hypothetical protein